MRLLATGDFHLSEHGPVADWLERQEQVLAQIADLAYSEQVDALLIAGDVFDRRRPTPAELMAFRKFLNRIDYDLPIICVSGNHDLIAADVPCGLDVFADRITLARIPGVHHFGRTPGTQNERVSVAMLPWTPLGWIASDAPQGMSRDELYIEAADRLVDIAASLRRQIDGTAILLAHWAVDESVLPSGMPVADLREVVLSLDALEEQEWDAICMGHIHKAQAFSGAWSKVSLGWTERPYRAPSFYTGSPYCLNFGQEGQEHGAWILDLEGEDRGRFVPLDGPRFITMDFREPFDTIIAAPEVEDAIVRVRYEVTEEQAKLVDNEAIRQALLDAGAFTVTVQQTIVRESRARVEGMDETLGERDALEAWCKAEGVEAETHAVLDGRLTDDLAEAKR